MTNAVRNHIHIWEVGQVFDSHEYHVAFGGKKETPAAIATHVRALNASSHPHVLVDEAGDPILVKDATLKVFADLSEHEDLVALQGRSCYYLPLIHMADEETHHIDDVPESPGYQVFMMPIVDDENLDPVGNYWGTVLALKDDSF